MTHHKFQACAGRLGPRGSQHENLSSRDGDITNITITNVEELGSAATQVKDQRARSLGFTNNATGTGSITAALAMSTSGRLAEDVDLVITVGTVQVPLIVRAAAVNESIVQEELNTALARAALPANITVSVVGNAIKFTSAVSTTVLKVSHQALDTSRASVSLVVDLDDDSSAGTGPDAAGRISFKDLYDAGGDAIGSLVLPMATSKAFVRLHVGAGEPASQGLGTAGGAIGLPSMTFDFSWDAAATWTTEGSEVTIGDPYFYNVELDPGSIINSVVGPVVNTLKTALDPVLDLLDTAGGLFNANLPVIDKLFSSISDISGVLGKSDVGKIVSYVQLLTKLPTYLRNITQTFTDLAGKPISFGSYVYQLGGGGFQPVELGLVKAGITAVAESVFSNDLELSVDFPGLSIDLLTPANALKLLTGQTFNLVSYGLPTLTVSGTLDLAIPTIPIGIPGVATVDFNMSASGSVCVTTPALAIRYDSTGLRSIVDTIRAGSVPNPLALLDGVYLDLSAGSKLQVAANFSGSTSAYLYSGAFNAVVADIAASINVGGSAFLQIRDPNKDNQVRLNEIFTLTNNFSSPQNLIRLFDAGVTLGGAFSTTAPLSQLWLRTT